MRGDNTDERTTEAVRGDEPSAEDVPSPDRLACLEGVGQNRHAHAAHAGVDEDDARGERLAPDREADRHDVRHHRRAEPKPDGLRGSFYFKLDMYNTYVY